MTASINLLIAALGGEGGGVLTNWIVAAAHGQGLPVQATSIPGVAQRTGATTYYVEIWPEAVTGDRQPVLALSPAPGEVDMVATTELLETGRCISNGFVSPERTHLIASINRVYTTTEKIVVGDGRLDDDALIAAAKSRAQTVRLVDLETIARNSGSRTNAVMLGLLAGSGKLPISHEVFEDAIQAMGVSVQASLNGFAAGLEASDREQPMKPEMDLLAEAETRLTTYQDKAYATLYRDRLKDFSGGVLAEVSKGLLRWMAYEDIIRVAQLKTRPGRLNQLSGGVAAGEVVRITEYFRPGVGEVCDILPAGLARRILAWAANKPKRLKLSWPLALRSTTISGFLALKFLAFMRPMRRLSYRYKIEQAGIDRWLTDIARAGPPVALEIALNARLIKGYGDTHVRGQAAFEALQDEVAAGAGAEAIAEARSRALSNNTG